MKDTIQIEAVDIILREQEANQGDGDSGTVYLEGAAERGQCVGAQRMTDGDVALDGERRDGQHGRRRRRLRQERLEATVRLAEYPRIGAPDCVQLRRQTCNNHVAAAVTLVSYHAAVRFFTIHQLWPSSEAYCSLQRVITPPPMV